MASNYRTLCSATSDLWHLSGARTRERGRASPWWHCTGRKSPLRRRSVDNLWRASLRAGDGNSRHSRCNRDFLPRRSQVARTLSRKRRHQAQSACLLCPQSTAAERWTPTCSKTHEDRALPDSHSAVPTAHSMSQRAEARESSSLNGNSGRVCKYDKPNALARLGMSPLDRDHTMQNSAGQNKSPGDTATPRRCPQGKPARRRTRGNPACVAAFQPLLQSHPGSSPPPRCPKRNTSPSCTSPGA
eukprot:7384383-Prymnesium_polylepis.1